MTLVSTAYYDRSAFPAWLAPFAAVNPVSLAADAVRDVLLTGRLWTLSTAVPAGVLPGLLAGGRWLTVRFLGRLL